MRVTKLRLVFKFCMWLVEKVEQVFWNSAEKSKTHVISEYFWQSIAPIGEKTLALKSKVVLMGNVHARQRNNVIKLY